MGPDVTLGLAQWVLANLHLAALMLGVLLTAAAGVLIDEVTAAQARTCAWGLGAAGMTLSVTATLDMLGLTTIW